MLYLQDTVSEEGGLAVSEDLLTNTTIRRTTYISKDDAMRGFTTSSGFGGAPAVIGEQLIARINRSDT
jgi:cell division protein FtsX